MVVTVYSFLQLSTLSDKLVKEVLSSFLVTIDIKNVDHQVVVILDVFGHVGVEALQNFPKIQPISRKLHPHEELALIWVH